MFRFSIRDLLWLTVVVGLCIALWSEHRSARRWQWAAEGLAKQIEFSQRVDVKFTAKGVTLNWPD